MYGDIVIVGKKTILMPKEKADIVEMLSNDLSRDEIGKKLGMSKKTVDSRCEWIRKTLGCKSMNAVIAIFLRKGLIK